MLRAPAGAVPFVALCVRGAPGWFRRSVRGSLVAQSASYGVLFMIGIGLGGFVRPHSEYVMVATLRPDLRNLVVAEEACCNAHRTCAARLKDLSDSAAFRPSRPVVVTILEATPPVAGRTEGEPTCH